MSSDKSLTNHIWREKKILSNLVESFSQKKSISHLFSKLLLCRDINEENFDQFINSNILNNLPDPFELLDMKKGIKRCCEALYNNENIGIIADYDVDGSTSASILYKFLKTYSPNITIKIPSRLSEGYGPNLRLMDEMLKEKVSLLFTLDCGTSAFNIIDHPNYNDTEVIVIDHHLSEFKLPNVHSIINPNRHDENSKYKDFAAVGVTFLFLMALRKYIRELNLFPSIKEPNLLFFLDLVAVGTICDIVNINSYNRSIVKKGLDLIHQRRNKILSKIIDNTKINNTPTARDIGFSVGPQINAASRIDDSSLATKLLISDDENEIDIISRKLYLINEKRKLIEDNIFKQALEQVYNQHNEKYIIVYKENWHHGVLGIVASKLVALYNKPSFVISFNNGKGTCSGRSIDQIDIGNLVLELKNTKLIEEGGGHKMAVGLKLQFSQLENFQNFLRNKFSSFQNNLFQKTILYDAEISVNQINNELLNILEQLEPFGKGNEEPEFLIKDIIIEKIKIIKDKHFLIFFKNDQGLNLKGISFNSKNTEIGDYLLKHQQYKFYFLASLKRDNFTNNNVPQLIFRDIKVIN
mgnify:CR=1 FL=1